MPNPLFGAARLNTTKDATTDRPQAVPPRLESYEGENNAYRGIQDHGVESISRPDGFDGYEDMHSGEFEPAKPDPDPVAVRIVDLSGKELRRFQTRQVPFLNGEVKQIVGRNPSRTKVQLMMWSSGTIFIGNSDGVRSYTGYPLSEGPVTLNTEDEVWACGNPDDPPTNQLAIVVLEEFTVKE